MGKKNNKPITPSNVLTGNEDRKSVYNKNFYMKLGLFSAGGILAGIVIGYIFGGGDVNQIDPVSIIKTFLDPSFDRQYISLGLLFGFVIAICADAYAYTNYEKYKNMRRGEEHGSAKLMTPSEMPAFNQQFFYDPNICKKYDWNSRLWNYTYYDKNNLKLVCTSSRHNYRAYRACFKNSQIMGQNVYLSMNAKFINRNLNTLTIGGSGQGKSYSELFPNALSANCNYVFTDPSGEIFQKTGRFLISQGYKIKVFNVDEFHLSMKYNPLAYVERETDYNILVDALNKNIKVEKKSGTVNDFFEDGKDSLMCALFALLKELYPIRPIPKNISDKERKAIEAQNLINRRRQTLSNAMELLRMAEQEQDENGNACSTLDSMFESLRQVNRRSYAAKMWKNFKIGGQKVCNEIIISVAAVFGRFFDTDELAWLTLEDELHLEELASEEKCALFLIIPQDTKTYNFMVSMIYSQLFSIAAKAGKKWRDEHDLENPSLPRHLSFWLDEFANCGKIPSFLELLSVVRKYNISINIIIQGMAQLKKMYPQDEWEIIMANLDTMIYLGGMEPTTVKWLSEKIGKETINLASHGYSKQGSENISSTGRALLTTDEIEQMSRSNELVFISGCKPIQTRKYDLTTHPNYKYSGEANPKNNLNINKIFKDNEIDYDILDLSLITREDIIHYNFDNLYLKKGHKRGMIAPKEPTTADKIMDINQDETLTDTEKIRRINELKNGNIIHGQRFHDDPKRILATNAQLYDGYSPSYEFDNGEAFDFTELNLNFG